MSSDINVQTFSGKVNITSNLLVGSSHLFVDTINNRVGLVTTTPDAGIHVNSNAYVHTNFRVGSGIVMNDTTGRITAGSFVGDGSGITSVNSDSGSWVNGTDVVYLSTIGDKVGIGTVSPSSIFNTYGGGLWDGTDHTSKVCATLQVGRGSGAGASTQDAGTGAILEFRHHSDYRFVTLESVSEGNYSSEMGIRFKTMDATSGPEERMRIDAHGNVGIGVTTVDSGIKLQVNGVVKATGFTGIQTSDVPTLNQNTTGTSGGIAYTQLAVNSPNVTSGTWTTATSASWGPPKFNTPYDQYAYNDAPGHRQWNIPTGMKSAYISQLTWNTGGYADVHGVQSDGGLVFLRRINTRQGVENTDEGGPQYDGSSITFIGSGLDSFSAIRITNKLGRIHLSGIAFTPTLNGTEGVGMVHPQQLSTTLSANQIPTLNQNTTGSAGSCSGNSATASSCTGNSATATTAGTCTGNSATATTAGNADTVDGQHAHEMSWGHDTVHGTYTDFNTFINTDKFGAHYITGTTNGPGQSGPTQYYHQRMALGSGHNQYSLQLAIGRGRTDNYLWYRNEENSSASSWYKMRAGYADSAGSATSATSATTASTAGTCSGNSATASSAATLSSQAYINRVRPYSNYYASGYNTAALEIREYNQESSTGGTEWSRAPRIGFHWAGRVASQLLLESSGAISCVNNPGTAYEQFKCAALTSSGQIMMTSLRATAGSFATRLDWPNNGHHVDCYHSSGAHVFHMNYYAQQAVYLNRTAYSDRRIKEDIKDIDDVSALNILRKIKPKTYKYKLQPHKGTVYGFIAQDVREVLPYATNLTKLSAPFDREKFVNATILEDGMVNLNGPCNDLEVGKMAYFYYESSTSTRDFEVTEIISPTQFRVRVGDDASEWIGNTMLVGKEVNDFHGIDKDAIFTVATAALQEVDRQLQAEKTKTYELQQKVEILEMSHGALIQRIEALEKL